MGTLLLLLSVPAYLYAGYFIGNKSLEKWKDEDNDSLASKLLFPYNAHCGTVGEARLTMIEVLEEGMDDYDNFLYRVLMSALWPVKLFWNIPGLVMFGGPSLAGKVFGALAGRVGNQSPDLLPGAGDDIPRLYGKVRAIDEGVRELLIKRGIVMDEIDHQRNELGIVIETEQELLDPPEIPPQLTDGKKEEE